MNDRSVFRTIALIALGGTVAYALSRRRSAEGIGDALDGGISAGTISPVTTNCGGTANIVAPFGRVLIRRRSGTLSGVVTPRQVRLDNFGPNVTITWYVDAASDDGWQFATTDAIEAKTSTPELLPSATQSNPCIVTAVAANSRGGAVISYNVHLVNTSTNETFTIDPTIKNRGNNLHGFIGFFDRLLDALVGLVKSFFLRR